MRRRWPILALLTLAGCGPEATQPPGPPPPPPTTQIVSAVTVTLAQRPLIRGQTAPATATALTADGVEVTGQPVTWQSANTQIATVSSAGVVTARAVGATTVSATIQGVTGAAAVEVVIGPAAQLTVVRPATDAVHGRVFGGPPVVGIADAYGNLVSTASAVVGIAVNDGASLIGAPEAATVSGVATFAGTGIDGVIGTGHTLTFSAPGLVPVAQSIVVEPYSFGTASHYVGLEIPPGQYRSINQPDASCYWERVTAFGALGQVIANGLGAGPAVVAIAGTDKGFASWRCASWVEVFEPATASPTADFGAGTYLVGMDIAAGVWQATGGDADCFWERLRGLGGTPEEVIERGDGPGSALVTLDPTDAGLRSQHCGVWSKIG